MFIQHSTWPPFCTCVHFCYLTFQYCRAVSNIGHLLEERQLICLWYTTVYCHDTDECLLRLMSVNRSHMKLQSEWERKDEQIDLKLLNLYYTHGYYRLVVCHWIKCKSNCISSMKIIFLFLCKLKQGKCHPAAKQGLCFCWLFIFIRCFYIQ